MIKTAKTQRRRAYQKGHRAEWIAALLLTVKGYRVVARRYKTVSGEIDLIARRRNVIIFAEVKARSNSELALNAITNESKRRITNAGQYWISVQPDYANLSWRFDVVAVVPWRWPTHYKDVW